jgi:hypothetical protein
MIPPHARVCARLLRLLGGVTVDLPPIEDRGRHHGHDEHTADGGCRLGSGYCLRACAQGACPYANICEQCPSFRTDTSHLAVLAAQRVDVEALAADAEARGWISEAERHRNLMARLDALLAGEAVG